MTLGKRVIAPVAAIAALVAPAAGLTAASAHATASAAHHARAVAAPKRETLRLTADPHGKMAFNTKRLTARAGIVTLSMHNPKSSGLRHGIAIKGNGVKKSGAVVAPGGTSTVTVQLKRGTYEFYCPVPGHAQAGMKGTLTVR
jgi:uncharacterized cupredoxin-like copper-binding protein